MLDYCEQEQVSISCFVTIVFFKIYGAPWHPFTEYCYKGDLALCCFLIGGYDIDSATSMSWVSGEDLAYTNWYSS